MQVTAQEVTIIELEGPLDILHRYETRPYVADAVDASHGDVLLDLRRVCEVDSSGLSMLIATGRQLTLQGRQLLLVMDDPGFLQLVERVGVAEALNIFPSAEAALGHVRSAGAAC